MPLCTVKHIPLKSHISFFLSFNPPTFLHFSLNNVCFILSCLQGPQSCSLLNLPVHTHPVSVSLHLSIWPIHSLSLHLSVLPVHTHCLSLHLSICLTSTLSLSVCNIYSLTHESLKHTPIQSVKRIIFLSPLSLYTYKRRGSLALTHPPSLTCKQAIPFSQHFRRCWFA